MGHSRPLFIYFCLFNTVDIKQVNKQMFNKILPIIGVEPRISGIESDRSTNWATTTLYGECHCTADQTSQTGGQLYSETSSYKVGKWVFSGWMVLSFTKEVLLIFRYKSDRLDRGSNPRLRGFSIADSQQIFWPNFFSDKINKKNLLQKVENGFECIISRRIVSSVRTKLFSIVP